MKRRMEHEQLFGRYLGKSTRDEQMDFQVAVKSPLNLAQINAGQRQNSSGTFASNFLTFYLSWVDSRNPTYPFVMVQLVSSALLLSSPGCEGCLTS